MTRIRGNNIHFGEGFVLPIDQMKKDEASNLKKFLNEEKARMEGEIEAAKLTKAQVIKDGEQKALEIIAQANKILEDANTSAEQIVTKATQDAESKHDEICAAATKEGYDKGYADGHAQAIADLEDKFDAINSFAKSKYDVKHNIIRSAELEIIDLILAISTKICKKSLEDDTEILKNITLEAIKLLKDKESITIMVHPELAERIYSISDKLRESVPQLSSIKVIEDKNISPDGTIVETPLSRVDCRIKTQIDEIVEKMMDEYYKGVNEPSDDEDEVQEIEVSEVALIEETPIIAEIEQTPVVEEVAIEEIEDVQQ